MPYHYRRCSQLNQSEALCFRPPLSLEPPARCPLALEWCRERGRDPGHTPRPAWCARQTSGLGESYCLTHPCPPGEVQGSLKWTKRYRVWGRTPASTKAHWKKHAAAFCALGIFLTSGYIFTLAGSLRMQVLCSLKFTKCPTGTFWLKLVAITRRIAPEVWEENPPNPPLMAAPLGGAGGGGGAGGAPPAEPAKPPTEAPEALQPHLDLLTKPLALILVAKQIPWVVQAKLAQEGYVTVEDLGDRWNTPEDARAQGPRDLEFRNGENNFDEASSRFTAMRLLQAVRAAKSMAQTQLHVGRATAIEPPGTGKGPLDSLCDRRVLETASYSCLKPRLESQGSDAYLKRQFKHIAAGNLATFRPSALSGPFRRTGNAPSKPRERCRWMAGTGRMKRTRPDPRTRRQLERTHTVFRTTLLMCIAGQPQFAHLRLSKETLDEWYEWFYGEDIAGRQPPLGTSAPIRRAQRMAQDS